MFISDFKTQEDNCICKALTTSLPILTKIDLAKYKDRPLIEKARIIAAGI